jgi:hypothetical protein
VGETLLPWDRVVAATDETIGFVLRRETCPNIDAARREFADNGVTKFYPLSSYECGRPVGQTVIVRRVL